MNEYGAVSTAQDEGAEVGLKSSEAAAQKARGVAEGVGDASAVDESVLVEGEDRS